MSILDLVRLLIHTALNLSHVSHLITDRREPLLEDGAGVDMSRMEVKTREVMFIR